MSLRKHSHPKYIQWFKSIFFIFSMLYPVYLFLTIPSKSATYIISFFLISTFSIICILIAAYFFQDIWVDDEGLFVEFLWMKIKVKWEDVEEIKSVVFSPFAKVVITKKLSWFHKIFGLLYGLTTKPAFVIYPSISDYELLVKDIESHVTKKYRNN